ncbi:MAG: cytochrome b [Chelatococcus sp.]|uniref:cytochrome b n=1 Tax=unclassified Chelatococcus TaxID=2638111 RepID=UPI001BD13D42|nr:MULTISPECIES: cytochrome b/b6 domain-containing protein [unclassified Chelatococcus]CAH1670496.1 putative Superoxide oxidase [Hyphomicrobiales bacterium]MBS7739197.1 cytochrome b [Chelatococcus sp. HY11]MBX3540146.1 cytochrome b [Chelatococcus sp.]MBX3543687.1 cytochrome b [Chelatococcus sp.]MCO5076270.1 cytochrome b/b6 domain-containing protein [Chelatococcus sp.]
MVDGSHANYDATTIRLHWLTVCLVVPLWILGQVADLFPHGPVNSGLWSIHVIMGFVLIPVILFRIVWRVFAGSGVDKGAYGAFYFPAKAAHCLLYALLCLVLILGVVNAFVRGYSLFGIIRLPQMGDPTLRRPVTGVHGLVANLLLGLVALHAIAALVHHYVLGDGVLRRMLPGWQRLSDTTRQAGG